MPLQNLVEYFNSRFEQEHHSSFRPFILEQGQVSGLFGPIRIDSGFAPLRRTLEPAAIMGYTAKIKVSTYEVRHLYTSEIESLLAQNTTLNHEFESVINFDRLSRTVHMLNFLPLTHLQDQLFLEVDSRHILGIKQDHGAYFQEVIAQCGLETSKIAIVLAANCQYTRYHRELIRGLGNYRRRGYQIALKFDPLVKEAQAFEFIQQLAPHYVSVSARPLDARDRALPAKLRTLRALVSSMGGQSILQHIDEKKSEDLARNAGFELVQGRYYEAHSSASFLTDLSGASISAQR